MSPGILGNRVSSMRIPTEKPKMFWPPLTLTLGPSPWDPHLGTLTPIPASGSPWLVELSELLPRLPKLPLHGLVVGGVGKFRQVALQVSEAAPELAHVGPRETAIAPLVPPLGVQHEQPVDHADDAVPRLPLPIDPLQVREDAREELSLCHGCKVLGRECHLAPECAPDQLLACLRRQQRSRVEGVEKDLRVAEARPRDEVARKSDAFDGEPEALADFHQHESERDRDTLPPVEDIVEKAVARVVVVLAIAGEPLRHEEVLAQAVEAADRIGRPARAVDAGGLERRLLELLRQRQRPRGRAAGLLLRPARRGESEQERAAQLVVEVLVGFDDFSIESGSLRVPRPLAELDELAVLHHGDGLARELAGRDTLDGGGESVEVLEEGAVALGDGIEAPRIEAQLAQTVGDHAVVLRLVAGLAGEGHFHLHVVGRHEPARGDLCRLDLVLERDLEEVEHRQVARNFRLERGFRIQPLQDRLVASIQIVHEFFSRHAATPDLRSSGSSWVSVSFVTTRVQRPWSGWVALASAWVVNPSTGERGVTLSSAVKKAS